MQTFWQNVPGPLRFNVFLLGKIGAGKSSSGNTLLGRKSFIAKKSFARVTKEVQKETVTLDGVTLDVYDTPGYTNNPETYNDDVRGTIESVSQSVPSVILLVLKFDRFTPEEKETVELIEQMLPDRLLHNIWILFTGGDELERENLSMKELIEETDELKKLMLRFQNGYHIFNNFSQSAHQVKKLIKAIRGASLTIPSEVPLSQAVPRRIVLLGKTGVGKSATGNTILGEKRFRSESNFSSITTQNEMQQADVAGRTVDVVDTPGLFDTNISAEKYAVEIGNSIYLSSPGPHAFLYVLPVNARFTEQEEDVVQKCELIFGKGMKKYTVILFTHGDLLKDKSVDVMINENSDLSRFVDECGGRYHVFNNEKSINRDQVNKLLEKIDRMVEHNGGHYYTNEMYEDAARFRKAEEEREWKERRVEFIKKHKKTLLIAGSVAAGGPVLIGPAVGAVIGVCVAGPAGAVAGAAAGAAVGAIVGLTVGTVGGVVYRKTVKQGIHEQDPNLDHNEDLADLEQSPSLESNTSENAPLLKKTE